MVINTLARIEMRNLSANQSAAYKRIIRLIPKLGSVHMLYMRIVLFTDKNNSAVN